MKTAFARSVATVWRRRIPFACDPGKAIVGCSRMLAAALLGLSLQVVAVFASDTHRHHDGDTLRVLTLNIAHGRGEALNQVLVGRQTALGNLDSIAALLRDSDAQVVGLQEIDAPSLWSRNIDQPERIVSGAGYLEALHSVHASSVFYDYGTALLSTLTLTDPVRHTFEPSPPTTDKGFTLGQVTWQPADGQPVAVDIVSVHLDFSRRQVRQDQAREIRDLLMRRNNPVILMGDFNSDWSDAEDAVRLLAADLGLSVYRPEATDLGTYDDGQKRLDWILVSSHFAFVDYRVLPDSVSDHRAVVASLRLQ